MTTPGKRKATTNLTRKVMCQFCKEFFSIGRSYTCHYNKCPSRRFADPFFIDSSVIGTFSHLPATVAESNTASLPFIMHNSSTLQHESNLTSFNNDNFPPRNCDNSSSSSFLINQNREDNNKFIGSPASTSNDDNDFHKCSRPTFIDNNLKSRKNHSRLLLMKLCTSN